MNTDNEISNQLLADGLITEEEIESARELAEETQQSLRRVMVLMGMVSVEEVAEALAVIHQIEIYDIDALSPSPETILILPEEIAARRVAIALSSENGVLTIAMENPFDYEAIDEIEQVVGYRIEPVLGRGNAILRKLGEYHDHYRRKMVGDLLSEVTDTGMELAKRLGFEIASLEEVASEESEAVRTVHLLILQALQERASDIHIEPTSEHLRVRYRIDGTLHEVNRIPKALAPAVISRIKVMSNLNIAERRLPQDGHFHIHIEKRGIDFRVATTPTILIEKIVIRILDRTSVMLSLDVLGFDSQILRSFRKLLQVPHGLIIVTGPTGSGKTTTLYGALDTVGARRVNITTVEDPVEYQIDGITQIQVHPMIGLDFARCLRSILRQDPDVIFVGEIRDAETAQIAVRAALTGHLVFATLHTNDAASAVTRLFDMGIEPFLLASCLRGVLGQRLVRANCKNCMTQDSVDTETARKLGLSVEHVAGLKRGIGCPQCFATGFRGRSAVGELLIPDKELQELISKKTSAGRVRRSAMARGFKTLRIDGMRMVISGETTLEEVLYVTDDVEDFYEAHPDDGEPAVDSL